MTHTKIRQHVPKSIWNKTCQESKQPECQRESARIATQRLKIIRCTNKNLHLTKQRTKNFLFFLKQYLTLFICLRTDLNKWFLEQNLKIAHKKLIFKLFVRHLSGDKRRNKEKENLINYV